MSRAARSARSAIAEASEVSNLTLLAQTWGFEIEWDAPIGRDADWHGIERVLRIAPMLPAHRLRRIHRWMARALLTGCWVTSRGETPVTVGGKS